MKPTILSGLIYLLASNVAAAGVAFEIEVIDRMSGTTDTSEAIVSDGNLKLGVASSDGAPDNDMIFRGDRREMLVIDHERKSYAVIDSATIAEIGGKVSTAMSQMDAQIQEALKDVPADQRAMVEQMMKQRMPQQVQAAPEESTSEVRKTGDKGDKNGYPCRRYEVINDGRKVRDLWVTDWDNIEGGEETVEVFEDMADFFAELTAAMPSFAQGPGLDDNPFGHMREIGGFPVVTLEYADDGAVEYESSLKSTRKMSVDPDAFEPPSAYERQQMMN